jgi:hypothetical protein
MEDKKASDAKLIGEMVTWKPIPNPCPKMEELGYSYEYRKGLVDETAHYTRVEEDSIIYTGKDYILRFNLVSNCLVISQVNDNSDYYGGKPTLFLTQELLECIEKIRFEIDNWVKFNLIKMDDIMDAIDELYE